MKWNRKQLSHNFIEDTDTLFYDNTIKVDYNEFVICKNQHSQGN